MPALRKILKFPENREFNREFFGFSADSALRSNFNALRPNSLRAPEQGIFSPEQGIFRTEQGIRFP